VAVAPFRLIRDPFQKKSPTISHTTALAIEDGKVAAIRVVRNPDKPRHLH